MHKTMWLLAAVVVLGSRSAAAEVRVVELGPTLPEPHATWMTRIEQEWQRRYAN